MRNNNQMMMQQQQQQQVAGNNNAGGGFRQISANVIHNHQQQGNMMMMNNGMNNNSSSSSMMMMNNNNSQNISSSSQQQQRQQQQQQQQVQADASVNNNNNNTNNTTTSTTTGATTAGPTSTSSTSINHEYISSALPPIINSHRNGGGGSSNPLCITNMNRYVMREKLGQGTYGVVFRCDDTHTGMSVAMKKISEQRPEEGVPSIAIREIALLREVQHPNVVALHNVIPRDRELMLVFEYVDQDLKKLLDSRITPFHGQKLKWIMYQLLQGMAACHSKRIVHRDLKPQNILVSKNEGVVKIADFGLARAFHVTLHSYTREVVTLWYRAPEILLGEKHYRPSIDIWSLGCIMAELATKRALFPGDCEIHQLFLIFKTFGTPSETSWPGVSKLAQYNEGYPKWRPADLRNYVPGLDAHGLNLLKGMLQVDPLERISAAAALQHPWFDEIRDAYSQQFADYRNW